MTSNILHFRTKDAPADCRREITEDGRWMNAIAKSKLYGLRAHRVCTGLYWVRSTSRKGLRHYIGRDQHGFYGWACDCEAAQSKQPCAHLATYLMRLDRETPQQAEEEPTPMHPVDAGLLLAFNECVQRDPDFEAARLAPPTALEKLFT